MQLKKEQDEKLNSDKVKKYRWLRKVLLTFATIFGFFGLSLMVLGTYLATQPVDLTFFAKHWLPVPVIHGDKGTVAGKLTFNQLVVAWPVQKQGLMAPLYIEVHGLRLLDSQGHVKGCLDYGQVTLPILPLFKGELTPQSIKISRASLNLKKTLDNHIVLDVLNQKTTHRHSKAYHNFYNLKYVEIQDGNLNLSDVSGKNVLQVKKLNINVRQEQYTHSIAFLGKMSTNVYVKNQVITLVAESLPPMVSNSQHNLVDANQELNWSVKIFNVNPSTVESIFPIWSDLKKFDGFINAQALLKLRTIDIKKPFKLSQLELKPHLITLNMQMGHGSVQLKNQVMYPSSIHAQITADFTNELKNPLLIKVEQFEVQLRSPQALTNDKSGPLLQFKGYLHLSQLLNAKNMDLGLDFYSLTLKFQTIHHYWPSFVAKGAYAWVTKNITHGIAHNFHLVARLTSDKGWEHLNVTHLSGGIEQAEQMQVYWLRPVPPLQDMKAQLIFVDPDRIKIQYQGGYQIVYPKNKPTKSYNKLSVPNGEMWITGLSKHDEMSTITTTIKGSLQNIIALLYEPRLKLLSRHPVGFKTISGEVKTFLRVELPLKKDVKIEQVNISAHNKINDAHLAGVALGKDLRNADLMVDVDTKHLVLSGNGLFSTFPVDLTYTQNFSHQNRSSIIEKAHMHLQVSPEALQRSAIDLSGNFSGQAFLDADYIKSFDKKASVKLNLNLGPSAISLPLWNKPLGQQAMVSVKILLDDDHLKSIQQLAAYGKDLSLQANTVVKNETIEQVSLEHFQIGKSTGTAVLNFPLSKEALENPSQGTVRLSIKAQDLDISAFARQYLKGKSKKEFETSKSSAIHVPIAVTGRYDGPRGRKWIVNLQTRRIFYEENKFLGDVTAYLEYDGIRLMHLSYGMRKPIVATASLFSVNHMRRFHLEAQDFGKALAVVGISAKLKGGHLVLEGRLDDNESSAPFRGKIYVNDITLNDAPSTLLKLSDASIYGLFKRQKAKEIIIDRIEGLLYFKDGIFQLSDGLIHNAEIGATLASNIDVKNSFLDMKGTIVPAYAINSLLGGLPGVGFWFSPEKGGGFIAVPFNIKGPFVKPRFEVYPSRIFTPGALREFFRP